MTGYRLADNAILDLNEIWAFIAADDPLAADRVENTVHEACSLLVDQPTLGHFRRDLTRLNVRFFTVMKNYLVIYEPETQPLRIVRVPHAARDLKSILK